MLEGVSALEKGKEKYSKGGGNARVKGRMLVEC